MTNGFVIGKVYYLLQRSIWTRAGGGEETEYSVLEDARILKTNYVRAYLQTRTGFKTGEQSCNFKLKIITLLSFYFL